MFNLSNNKLTDEDFELGIAYAAQKLNLQNPKPQQVEALTNFLKGRDLFVNLPTGYGKSTIFHGAPLACDFLNQRLSANSSSTASKPTIAVVIAPIVALIQDQVKYLNNIGIPATHLYGTNDSAVWSKTSELIKSGQISVVFASPETLTTRHGKDLLSNKDVRTRVCGLFVDECHCIAKWYVVFLCISIIISMS